MATMDRGILARRAKRTLRENRAALRVSEQRSRDQVLATRRSSIAIERALRELRRARILS